MGFEEWINIQKFLGQLNMDGGPGSGNWGHSGRPGQRGGSGSGGGVANRVQAEFGFTSKAQTIAYTKKKQKEYNQQIGKILKEEDERNRKGHLTGVVGNLKAGDEIHLGSDDDLTAGKYVKTESGNYDYYYKDYYGDDGWVNAEVDEGFTSSEVAESIVEEINARDISPDSVKMSLSWEARSK